MNATSETVSAATSIGALSRAWKTAHRFLGHRPAVDRCDFADYPADTGCPCCTEQPCKSVYARFEYRDDDGRWQPHWLCDRHHQLAHRWAGIDQLQVRTFDLRGRWYDDNGFRSWWNAWNFFTELCTNWGEANAHWCWGSGCAGAGRATNHDGSECLPYRSFGVSVDVWDMALVFVWDFKLFSGYCYFW